jgi:hypothetical protein
VLLGFATFTVGVDILSGARHSTARMTGFLFELPFFPEKKKGRNSYGKLPKRLLPAKVLSPFRRRTTLFIPELPRQGG